MKPGDLVVLKCHDFYVGLDISSLRYFTISGDSVGVFLRRALEPDKDGYVLSDDYILTHGRVLACKPGDWRVVDEAG